MKAHRAPCPCRIRDTPQRHRGPPLTRRFGASAARPCRASETAPVGRLEARAFGIRLPSVETRLHIASPTASVRDCALIAAPLAVAVAVQTCSFISLTTAPCRGIDKLSPAVPARQLIDIPSADHMASQFTTTSGGASSHNVRLAERRTADVPEPPGTSGLEERRLYGGE